jgi:hypothetical protein
MSKKPGGKPTGKAKKSPAVARPADVEKAVAESPAQQNAHPDKATEEEIRSWEDAHRKEQLWKRDHLPAMQKEAKSEMDAFEKTAKELFKVSNYAPEILDSAPLIAVMDLCLQMLQKTIKHSRGDTAVVPLLKSMSYGCDVLAGAVIHGKNEGVRLAAAEQILQITGECHHWLEQVTTTGILDETIKQSVAWPVVVSLHPKNPRYHKRVVSILNQKGKGMGSLSLIGRVNASGGKSDSLARARANHIHDVIVMIYGLKKRPPENPEGQITSPFPCVLTDDGGVIKLPKRQIESRCSWDTSRILWPMRFSVELVVSCHPDLFQLIKEQSSLVPSEKLWKEVAVRILSAFWPDLKKIGSGRRKKGVSAADPKSRRMRYAIQRAYIELRNEPNKSHDIPGKYGDSKKRRKLK